MNVKKAQEVFEYLDRMFSGDTESMEVRASEWRALREYLEPLREPLPTLEAVQARAKVLRETGVKLHAANEFNIGDRVSFDGWITEVVGVQVKYMLCGGAVVYGHDLRALQSEAK